MSTDKTPEKSDAKAKSPTVVEIEKLLGYSIDDDQFSRRYALVRYGHRGWPDQSPFAAGLTS